MDEDPALLPGPSAPARPSLAAWLGVTALLTPLAAVAGGLVGWHLVEAARTKASTASPETAAAPHAYTSGTSLRELAPVITNLADPPEAWVRLQAAIVVEPEATKKVELLAAQIGEDILAYLRTASLASIGGASGLRHLREDLNERARIRSDGEVRELVIFALVVQ